MSTRSLRKLTARSHPFLGPYQLLGTPILCLTTNLGSILRSSQNVTTLQLSLSGLDVTLLYGFAMHGLHQTSWTREQGVRNNGVVAREPLGPAR
jgi:hypothetical protein